MSNSDSNSKLAGLGDASRFRAISGGVAEYSTGSEGAGVMELQKKLEKWGFPPGPIDGIFGPLTKEAVQALQRKLGVPATGAWDSVTSQAVEADLARTPSVLLARAESLATAGDGATGQTPTGATGNQQPESIVKRIVTSPFFWAAAAVGGLALMLRSGGAEVTIDGIAFGASEAESAGEEEAPDADADELEAAVARAEKRKRAAAKKRRAKAAAAKKAKAARKLAGAETPASEMTIDVTPEAVTIEEENADG